MDKSVCISHFYKTEPHPLVAKAPQVVTYEPLGTRLITNISHLIIRNKYQQVKMKINLVIFDYYLQ